MKMGSYIKLLREEKGLSQDALGKLLGVNRAAVNKWETGQVENLKRSTIIELSKIFSVPACKLMCFEDCPCPPDETIDISTDNTINQELTTQKRALLLEHFNKLNDIGQNKAIDNLADLKDIPKYINK